jgi:hypothetical protein
VATWLIVLIFVMALGGIGWLVDMRARRRRRGLTSYSTSTPELRAQPRSAGEAAARYRAPGK